MTRVVVPIHPAKLAALSDELRELAPSELETLLRHLAVLRRDRGQDGDLEYARALEVAAEAIMIGNAEVNRG